MTTTAIPATFYKDDKHSHFFVKDEEMYEKLTNGRERHRLYVPKFRDNEKLTNQQIEFIEREYLK